jgi:7-cyano-7-deazaguanine synthase
MRKNMVLLSGGLDSVAALHLSLKRHGCENVAAIGFAYGQLHEKAELAAALAIANRRNVSFEVVDIRATTAGFVPDPVPGIDRVTHISNANIPARNAIMLSIAAARSAARWPGATIELVGGWNFDDKLGFPDCRPKFLKTMGEALALSLEGIASVSVLAPWSRWPKFQIVGWCKKSTQAAEDILESVSCYYGTTCQRCDACKFRLTAFRLAEKASSSDSDPEAAT